jgi:hypothetical protein
MLELRDYLINNWDIHYSNPKYRPCKNFLVVLWTEQATGRFTRNISLKFHYSRIWWISLKLCFLIFPWTWYGFYAIQKKVMGFRGGTKTFCWVNDNVGSKERDNEETTRSFNNNVSFEVDDWKEIEEYVLSRFNLEDKLLQDERKPAAIPTKKPSVKPSAIPHKEPSTKPVAIPHKNLSTIPPEDGKNDDDIAEDKKKPVAN